MRKGILEGDRVPLRDAAGRRYWRGKVVLADGSKARIEIPEPKCYSRTAARDHVDFCQEDEDATHTIYNAKVAALAKREARTAGAAGETCDAWFDRYNAYAVELGHTDASKKRDRWRKWISPLLGPKPIALVTRNDIEDVRDALDRAIAEWKRVGKSGGTKGRAISGKTAMNIWSCLTSSFKAATTSKRRDLRVLDGKANPCVGIEPPGDRESRQSRRKTFLYPREAAQLLANEIVEREWREVYAIALYTYLRPGELRVLDWQSVDLAAGVVNVTKAWDYEDCRIKPPKTRNGVRRVPIEPALVPLLERMREGREPTDLVVPTLAHFGEDHLAEQWRKHLHVASVGRAELHTSTRTHVMSNFRSCRDSGITWLALAGLDVAKMLRRAGHDHVQTTMGYVKLAEDLTGDLGTPFGPLPTSLVGEPPNRRPDDFVQDPIGASDARSTWSTQRSTQRGESSERVDRRLDGAEAVTVEHVISSAMTSQPGFDSLLRHHHRPVFPG